MLEMFSVRGTGKLVKIQHGPATVIGDESRNAGHCPPIGMGRLRQVG
jgi:hypothetical protein